MKDSRIYYEKVIFADSLKKDEIYTKLKTWALDLHVSQKDALQADDKETGILFYRGYFETLTPDIKIENFIFQYSNQYWHNLKFYIKDFKVKVVIDKVVRKAKTIGGASGISDQYIESSIEDYFELDSAATVSLPEKFKKQMKKTKEEILPKIIHDFKDANIKFKSLISQIETSIKSKSESDF